VRQLAFMARLRERGQGRRGLTDGLNRSERSGHEADPARAVARFWLGMPPRPAGKYGSYPADGHVSLDSREGGA
jgi:hypothetical protein